MLKRIFALALVFCFAGCVEQPKDLSKDQLEAARPYISKAKPAFAHPLDINFEDRVTLLGYDISPEGVIKPGQMLTITWYWQSKKKLDDGWLLFTHVEDAKTAPRINADSEGVIRKNYPPGKWKEGEFIKDVQTIRIPPDWDSPTITFYIGVWFGPHRLKVKQGAHDKENRARAVILQTSVKAKEELLAKLTIYKAASPVTVDGKLDDAAWKDARKVTLVDPVTGGKMLPPTVVMAAWDEQSLYVAFESEDDNLESTYKNRDEPLYDQDAVEVFLDPDGDQKNYYEFEVSPSNIIFDSFLTEYRKNNNAWNSAMKTAVVIEGTLNKSEDVDKKWAAELAIPLKDINVKAIKAGDKWKANFFRLDTAKTGRKAYAWNPPHSNDFHNLDSFGEILFEVTKPAGAETGEAAAQPAAGTKPAPAEGKETKPAPAAGGKEPAPKPTLKKLTMPPKAMPLKTTGVK